MNNLLSAKQWIARYCSIMLVILMATVVSLSVGAVESKPTSSVTFSITQGAGEFTQLKYFKFLAKPIQSSGVFVVNNNDVLWHTTAPVFSQVLLKSNGIYRRTTLDSPFDVVTQDNAINRVLSSVLTGNIDENDWGNVKTDDLSCVLLNPKSEQLAQLFSQIKLCKNTLNQRHITLFDRQNNKTEINMLLHKTQLSQQDVASLELP